MGHKKYQWNWDPQRRRWVFPFYPNMKTNKLDYAFSKNPPQKKPKHFPVKAVRTINHRLAPKNIYVPKVVEVKPKKKTPMEVWLERKNKLEKKKISNARVKAVMDKRTPMAIETDRSKDSINMYNEGNEFWEKYPSKADIRGVDDKVHFGKKKN